VDCPCLLYYGTLRKYIPTSNASRLLVVTSTVYFVQEKKAKLPNSQPLYQLSLFVNIFKQNYLGTANTVNPGHYTWLFNKSKHKDLAQFIIDFPGVFFYQDRYE
jgi:hypothetical protein